LLASLRYQTRIPEGIDPAEARAVLAPALDRARRALDPAGPEQITKALAAIADMLQVALPEEDGLALYVALLSKLPYPVLRQGMVRVAETHAWPRLPYPKEILDACRMPQAELEFWLRSIERGLALLEKHT
jgi:hypothetical protein